MKSNSKKKSAITRDQRRVRTQQIIFSVIAIIVIITWVVGMITRF